MDVALNAARTNNKSSMAKRWREAEAAGSLPEVLIADCVDEVIFDFLAALDAGKIRLRFVDDTGTEIDLGESEELGGWYMMADMPESWRARFSKERVDPSVAKASKKK
ncbi:MAG: hypothetical protein Q8K32_07630 [Archangium sp.]|nr:hypothetical protein [Archangium sp.]